MREVHELAAERDEIALSTLGVLGTEVVRAVFSVDQPDGLGTRGWEVRLLRARRVDVRGELV